MNWESNVQIPELLSEENMQVVTTRTAITGKKKDCRRLVWLLDSSVFQGLSSQSTGQRFWIDGRKCRRLAVNEAVPAMIKIGTTRTFVGDRHLLIVSKHIKTYMSHGPNPRSGLKEIHKNRLVPHEVLHPRPCFTAATGSHPLYPIVSGCTASNEAHCPPSLGISRLQAGRRRTLRPSRAPTGDDVMQLPNHVDVPVRVYVCQSVSLFTIILASTFNPATQLAVRFFMPFLR